MADNTIERELGWDDSIENDNTYTLMPEGDYDFTVVTFERQRHNGSEKLPACNKAVLTISVTDGVNSGQLIHNLFLHTRTEGMLCAFFTAIGQRAHGDKMNMNWNAVPGSTGRCKVVIREWVGSDGVKNQGNSIKKFYDQAIGTGQASGSPTFQAGAF